MCVTSVVVFVIVFILGTITTGTVVCIVKIIVIGMVIVTITIILAVF